MGIFGLVYVSVALVLEMSNVSEYFGCIKDKMGFMLLLTAISKR